MVHLPVSNLKNKSTPKAQLDPWKERVQYIPGKYDTSDQGVGEKSVDPNPPGGPKVKPTYIRTTLKEFPQKHTMFFSDPPRASLAGSSVVGTKTHKTRCMTNLTNGH